jgi:hypothetical protein
MSSNTSLPGAPTTIPAQVSVPEFSPTSPQVPEDVNFATILPIQRYQASTFAVRGSHCAEYAGTYMLVFDKYVVITTSISLKYTRFVAPSHDQHPSI